MAPGLAVVVNIQHVDTWRAETSMLEASLAYTDRVSLQTRILDTERDLMSQ